MKDIIIVCAGSFGKEVYAVISTINKVARNAGQEEPYHLLGFIDDNSEALKDSGIQAKVIGPITDWKPIGDEVYAIGAAFPDMKKKICCQLKALGCRFESLIAPWSIVSPDCEIGEGCFITAYSISTGVKLGNFVNVMGSMLCPGTQIGNYSTTTGFTVVEDATIGEEVFVGSHAVISSGIHVGSKAMISAGSIVCKDVNDGATVFGVPAEEIG